MTRDELIAKIRSANSENGQEFKKILNTFMWLQSLDDAAVAEMFTVARSTVARWKAGISSPHPYMCLGMYEDMITVLQQATQ